ncbi:Aminopeptidase N, partial [Nipponia nippon]
TDALTTSHPLTFREDEINTPAQISEVFDSIAYSKGASVLRMLSDFISEDVFKKGLQSYLHTFAYGNTVYTDLWAHLQEAVVESNVSLPSSISNIMDRWTLQMGFPVVTVNTLDGTVTQNHFRMVPPPACPWHSYTWIVPITWMTDKASGDRYWLTTSSGTARTASLPPPLPWWRLGSPREARVRGAEPGPPRGGQRLRGRGPDAALTPRRAKYINVTVALRTTRFLSKETAYMPWEAALNNLHYFQLMFDRSEVFGVMTKYIQKQVTPLFNHYKNITNNWGTIPSGLMNQYNEINAISTACSYGIPECQELATKYFRQWKENVIQNPIPPNLRSAIYCSIVATGGEEAWDFIWERLKKAIADKLRTALSCSPHPWILNR